MGLISRSSITPHQLSRGYGQQAPANVLVSSGSQGSYKEGGHLAREMTDVLIPPPALGTKDIMTRTLSLLAFLSLLASAAFSTAVPSPAVSPISLLYNNDLDLTTVGEHRSILLLPSNTQSNAAKACSAVHETLLPNNATFFKSDLVPLLRYQVLQGSFSLLQLFWIAKQGSLCQAADVNGHVSIVPCSLSLPTLCTQSAGYLAPPTSNLQITVKSQDLTITGARDLRSFQFFGIPYANAPARWTYPTAYTGSKSINATEFGNVCIQTGNSGGSEDCLFLNIWTPFIPSSSTQKKDLKAVMFWIHGGAFTGGTGSDNTFEGGSSASRGDVVFVTINYRLSTLGFLALNDGKTKGNFGFADQVAALEWVGAHISAFGGDPDRITIVGQSAGAASVRAHMASPKSIGKFAAALPMSNLAGSNYATTYSLYYTIPQEVTVAATPILNETGCLTAKDQLACLKAVDGHTLVNLPDVARYLVVDGTFLTSNGLPLNGAGPIAKVHTMMGFMRDDGAAFIGFPTNGNLTQFLQSSGLTTTPVGNPLFAEPTGPVATENVFNTSARITTDVEFRCLDQATAFSAIQHNLLESVWFYEFNRSYQTPGFSPNPPHCEAPVTTDHPFGDPSGEYYKCHSGELYYVFGTLPSTSSCPYRDTLDLPFMQEMVDVWTSFARTFDPNPDPAYLLARGYTNVANHLASLPKWQPVTKANVKGNTPLRVLQWGSFNTEFLEQEQCNFLQYPLTYFG